MRLSCCAYSYRDELTKGSLKLLDFIRLCREIGFDGVELTSYYFPTTERDFLNSVKRAAHREGVLISGTAVGNNFANPNADERQKHVEMTKAWVDHSVVLGAPTVRVFAGGVKEGEDRETAFQNVVTALQECAEYAWERGVMLALENHDGLTANAECVLKILKTVDRPGLALNVDCGNFRGDIYADIAATAPYGIATHVKTRARDAEGEWFPVDYTRVRTLMEEANYRGYWAMEYEDPEPPTEAVPRFFHVLKAALQG